MNYTQFIAGFVVSSVLVSANAGEVYIRTSPSLTLPVTIAPSVYCNGKAPGKHAAYEFKSGERNLMRCETPGTFVMYHPANFIQRCAFKINADGSVDQGSNCVVSKAGNLVTVSGYSRKIY